jgi:hypothetical protein
MIESVTLSLRPRLQVSSSFDSAHTEVYQNKNTNLPREATRCPGRKVRFHPEVLMQEVLHFKNYTPTEYTMSWYNEMELSQIKMEVQEVLSNLHSLSDDPEQLTATCRGLDAFTPHGAKKRRQNKKAGWASVFEIAGFPNNNLESYTQCLAKSYGKATQSSIQEAILRAKEMDKAAFSILKKGHKSRQTLMKIIPSWMRTHKQSYLPIQ